MPRAQFRDTVMLRGANGTLAVPPPGASAALYDEGTSHPISESIYVDSSSAGTLANPVALGADGVLNFWLAGERELDVVVACSGYATTRTTVTTDGASAVVAGLPSGGTTGQVLAKASNADYATGWVTQTPGLTLPLSQTLTFSPDNTYDIGASGASRPRNVYAAGIVDAGYVRGTSTIPPPSGAGLEVGYSATFGGTLTAYDRGAGSWLGLLIQSQSLTLTVQGNIMEQRNGANPQTLRLYETYTDSSNYGRMTLANLAGNDMWLMTEAAGTATLRRLCFGVGGARQWFLAIPADGTQGSFLPLTDNAVDIGSQSRRARNVHIMGAVATGVKAGAAVDGDVSNPTDGMLRVDSTNNRLYVRIGGAWVYVTLSTTGARDSTLRTYIQTVMGTLDPSGPPAP